MPKKLTHEEFLDKFKKQNSNSENIEILGKYEGSKIKIKCKCKIDGYEWEVTPNRLLSGNDGCPKCAIKSRIDKQTKTHEKFIQEIKEINDDIEILGTYKTNKTKIKCRCKVDGYEWETIPSNLLRGQGCPKCAGAMKLTHEEFLDKFKKQNSNSENIEILGKYINNYTKIKCKCKIDEYEWESIPNSLLSQNTGCPKCNGKIRNKTTEYFIQEMKEINDDIEIIGEYKGNKKKIKCRCKLDGKIWYAKPNNLLNGSGCPKCNASKGEKRIAEYLDSKNIDYIHDKRYFKDLKSSKNKILRPDFIIKNMKIWIEFDGEQHFEVIDFTSKNPKQAEEKFKETQENDRLKNEYAKKHNWKIIRIAYYDFDRIEEILDREL